jgi:hypothetical protein
MSQRFRLFGALLWAAFLVGCTVPAPKGTSSGGGSFHVDGTGGEICTRDGRVILVVWTDDASGSRAGGGDGRWHGEIRTHDGRMVPWSCTTADGTTGTVTIAGADFDLGRGPLFLVTTRGGAPRVQQLLTDVNGAGSLGKGEEFDAARRRLEELAASDETVKAFVKGAAAGKKAE